MLLILIPIIVVWLAVVAFVVCLCRMAAIADSERDAQPPQPRRAEVIVLERAPRAARAADGRGDRKSVV